MEKFTQEEKNLILEMIAKVTVSPNQENAIKVMTNLQSIITKLTTEEK